MLRRLLWTSIVMLACGGGEPCTPGRQVACACEGGVFGIQVCNNDGRSFGFCKCDSGGAGGRSGGGFGFGNGFGGSGFGEGGSGFGGGATCVPFCTGGTGSDGIGGGFGFGGGSFAGGSSAGGSVAGGAGGAGG